MLITIDWAMKFLPRKYREGMVDWFGKQGINWHVAVSLIKIEDEFQTMSHIHIFKDPVNQDAATTTAVICDIVEFAKKCVWTGKNPHHIRQCWLL